MSETPEIQPLSRERHGDQGWKRFQTYRFAAGQVLAPLSASEVARAALDLPLGFVKRDKGWQLVAVLGFAAKTNLFVEPNGRWHGGYVPASLRSYPFRIGRPDSSEQMILCIDESSGLLTPEGGEPFFDGAGKLSPPMAKIWSFMQKVAKGEAQLDALCARLIEVDIIEPWPISLKDGDNERKVEGLHRISEEKLGALDDETFGELGRSGLVALAYAQMLSAGNIGKLAELAKAHARHAETVTKQREAAAAKTAPAETKSGIGFGDSLDIDWSKIG